MTSTPGGIDCGPACSGTTGAFPGGTVVWLTATPAAGWVFVGWSGDLDCTDGVVTLTDPKTCVATFALTAPLNGGTSGRRTVTLQRAAAPNAGYEVCWDTTNNGVCDTAWQWNTTATRRVVEFLEPGTYYWQVRTFSPQPTEADDGAWWSVTVTGPPLFTKITPGNGAGGLGTTVTLQWTPVPDEGYAVCWDTTNNNTCDSAWWPNGGATARVLEGLSAGTYYWQVRTAGGAVLADNGAWHAFTVSTAALYTKQAPGNGATGLGSTVTLQWGAVPDEGYWVCWDTSDNGSCDSAWWPNGGATARVLEGLSVGTYFWQVKTAGGGVLADNGAWHHFTVAAEPLATSPAGASGAGAPDPASAERRWTGGVSAAGVAGAAGLTLTVLLAGPRRRRRLVAAGVMVFVLAPAVAWAQTTTQAVEYYTTDAIGSVRAVTKKVGTSWQVTHHDFMPFGEEVSPAYPPPDKRLFTGKERDTETGLDYFGARYNRANLGRFTTVDPKLNVRDSLVDPQRWNRYAYAANNGLRYVDPDGRDIVVIENGPTQGNPVGHTAIAVTRSGVFSFGNDTAMGSSLSAYVERESPRRDTTIYIIKTTPEQDAAAVRQAQSLDATGTIGVVRDNCSTRSNAILDAAGIPKAQTILPGGPMAVPNGTSIPGDAGARVAQSPELEVTVIKIPKGSSTVPSVLAQFEPVKK